MEKNELFGEIMRLYDRVTELENENRRFKEAEEARKAFSDVPDISWSTKVVDDSLNALKAEFVDEYFTGDRFNEIFCPYLAPNANGVDFDTWLDQLGADAFGSAVFCKSMTISDLKKIFREQLKSKYRKIGGKDETE